MDFGRKSKKFNIKDIVDFKFKAWQWSVKFETSMILENNGINYPHQPFTNVVAAGKLSTCAPRQGKAFDSLHSYMKENSDFIFGYFSYDLKNELEDLTSENPDFHKAPELFFFIPQHLIFFEAQNIILNSTDDCDKIFNEILETPYKRPIIYNTKHSLKQSISKPQYLATIDLIKEHLLNGDIYELNYCIEFSAKDIIVDPLSTFIQLLDKSPMPFSAFLKAGDQYIISASPERFLKKQGQQLVSQPIKGTIRRGDTEQEDGLLKNLLATSEKERSENMMIVDLVRNDLARSSVPGSVKVEEMFGIYTFKQLHQMISTVTSEIQPDLSSIDAIKNAFPMGSMTGAPKIRAMQLIEKYEASKRGMFSGAAGYFSPDGNFDFNVLIRSIFYNKQESRVSFQVGSAITYDADPEEEYNECLLKAKAIFEVLSGDK